MNLKPTTIERAYELARGGTCRTVTEIKQQLLAEGYERVRDSLYGPSLNTALRKLCQENYTPSNEDPPEQS